MDVVSSHPYEEILSSFLVLDLEIVDHHSHQAELRTRSHVVPCEAPVIFLHLVCPRRRKELLDLCKPLWFNRRLYPGTEGEVSVRVLDTDMLEDISESEG